MMIDMLKAMSDANRLKIIEQLSQKSLCVCELEEKLSLPQNLVSHHLSVLKEAGLITNCRCGKNHYYSVDKDKLNELAIYLNKMGGKR